MAGRRALLSAVLVYTHIKTPAAEVVMVRRWLDSWSGLGLVIVGMQRYGYDVTLTHAGPQRLGRYVPPPPPRSAPVGWAGAVLVADAMAGRPRGRLASAEHAVR